MLAYAVYVEGLDDDNYQQYSDFVQAFLREESALAHARDLTRKLKLIQYKSNKFENFYWDYRKDNPQPLENSLLESKPIYDHFRQNDREYNREHEKRIHEWKETVYPPFRKELKLWQEKYDIESKHFQSTFSEDVSDFDLENIELLIKYIVKQIEIFE